MMISIGRKRLTFGRGSLDTNHHGPKGATIKGTIRFYRLHAYTYGAKGIRAYLYAPSGKCWSIDLIVLDLAKWGRKEREKTLRGQGPGDQL